MIAQKTHNTIYYFYDRNWILSSANSNGNGENGV